MRPRLLFIDDETELLSLLGMNFELLGYDCFMATNPSEAEKILKDLEIDLVICDVVMPLMGGLELFNELKTRFPKLPPFFFCSGLVDFPLSAPFPPGIVGFIHKPFPFKQLLKEVETILATREL